MPESRRRFLAAVGASMAMGTAGCLSDGGDTTPTDTPTPDRDGDGSTDPATESQGTTVAVRNHDDHGDILVDGDGMTLYMFDSDEQGAGESSCTGGCIDNWPLLTVDGEPAAGDGVEAALSTFEHSETGDTQVAADGWPLYYFTPDEEPGDVNGQAVNDVWWLLDPSGEPIRASGDETEAGAGPYSLG